MQGPFRLDNKSAVITGGASGIGRAIAEVFADQGASVYILDIKDLRGQEVVNAIEANGGEVKYLNCDLTILLKVRSVFKAIFE